MGLTNAQLMVPFVRTLGEGRAVVDLLAEHGLKHGENHLTQLTLGICGQGPSDHPDLAEWLMDQGIDSISLNPDTVVDTWTWLAGHKKG